jgi:glycine betaine/proline transport system substrate-binding protein
MARRNPLIIWISIIAIFALVAGCADDGGDGDDENGAAQDGGGEQINLSVSPWTGSAVNAAIAQVILEDELGYDVELVEIDENAQWAGLSAGDLDASLEVWTSGHADNIATYVEDTGEVVDMGPLGVVGIIGWYIPTYLLDEHPELESWEGLEGNADIFATAETGDQGQFLAGDPSFVSWDEHIIDNLGLDFTVVQSGSEAALLSALEAAYEREDPLLFYFWEPHAAHAQFDLTQVELPPHDDECEAQAEEERACGYPEEELIKFFHAGLEDKAPDVWAFLDDLALTNEDQNEVAAMIEHEGMEWEDAARQWVEDNQDTWEGWLP